MIIKSVFDTFWKKSRTCLRIFIFFSKKKGRATWTLRPFIFFPDISGIFSGDFYDKNRYFLRKKKGKSGNLEWDDDSGNLEWDDGNPGSASEPPCRPPEPPMSPVSPQGAKKQNYVNRHGPQPGFRRLTRDSRNRRLTRDSQISRCFFFLKKIIVKMIGKKIPKFSYI